MSILRRLWPMCLAILALWATGISTAWASPSVFPTGTTIYDPARAYNSYVVFGAPDGKTHLIDMDGNEVHSWDKIGFPSEILDPSVAHGKKGELLVQLSHSPEPRVFGYMFANNSIGELDWDGNVVWSWGGTASTGAVRQNHDWNRLPNGNTLVVVTVDRVIASLSKKSIADQAIYEVTPGGQIVWRWSAADHIAEYGIGATGMALLRASLKQGDKGHGFLTINDMQPIGPNHWSDAGDKRFAPDNIVIDSREASFIAIIDKHSGRIVWRMGPDYSSLKGPALRPSLSQTVPRKMDQTSGQHDAHIIEEGLPGAGNLLIFDNEAPSGFPPIRIGVSNGSRVLEVNPVTKQIVWQYSALASGSPLWSFYSAFISSARRLPNGNTLIDEGMNGRFFQVTPAGEIVWEYVNPYFGRQVVDGTTQAITNWVFRAQPVPYDWAPSGAPHSETPVRPPNLNTFRVP